MREGRVAGLSRENVNTSQTRNNCPYGDVTTVDPSWRLATTEPSDNTKSSINNQMARASELSPFTSPAEC